MSFRFLSAAALICLSAACSAAPEAVAVAPERVLRVCADPNNLPFSNQRLEGFENRIADVIARELGARLEHVWWAQRRGFVRHTLSAGTCDVIVGVPSRFAPAATTRPYYRSTYVFVTRAGEPVPASFDDPLLKRAVVGVQLIGDDSANSPPAHALAARGIVRNVRGYSVYGDYRQPNPPAAIVHAVADGDLDVAVAWGPMAGFFAKQLPEPLTLTPVTPETDAASLPFVFDMSMAVARGNDALLAELDRAISNRRDDLDGILREFGVPRVDHGQGTETH
jgi:mxaJ protein